MPYTPANIPPDHSEFGGGPGMIDPMVRQDRALEGHQELWEIYATAPSAHQVPGGLTAQGDLTTIGEQELNPETATIGEVPKIGGNNAS